MATSGKTISFEELMKYSEQYYKPGEVYDDAIQVDLRSLPLGQAFREAELDDVVLSEVKFKDKEYFADSEVPPAEYVVWFRNIVLLFARARWTIASAPGIFLQHFGVKRVYQAFQGMYGELFGTSSSISTFFRFFTIYLKIYMFYSHLEAKEYLTLLCRIIETIAPEATPSPVTEEKENSIAHQENKKRIEYLPNSSDKSTSNSKIQMNFLSALDADVNKDERQQRLPNSTNESSSNPDIQINSLSACNAYVNQDSEIIRKNTPESLDNSLESTSSKSSISEINASMVAIEISDDDDDSNDEFANAGIGNAEEAQNQTEETYEEAPIYFEEIPDWPEFLKKINDEVSTKITAQYVHYIFRVVPSSLEDYQIVIKLLDEKKILYSTDYVPPKKPLKIVIKGLHKSSKESDIIDALAALKFRVVRMYQFKHKDSNKSVLPIFAVTLATTLNVNDIFELDTLLSRKITVEKYISRRDEQSLGC